MEDRTLSEIIRLFALAAEDDSTVFTKYGMLPYPQGVLEWLLESGFVKQTANARVLICDECEEECVVEPEFRTRPTGETAIMHCCGLGYGYIYFEPEDLYTWRINFENFISTISETLGLESQIETLEKNRLWYLGEQTVGRKTKRIFLGRGFHFDDSAWLCGRADELVEENDILIVFDRKPMDYIWPNPECTIIRLSEMVSVQDRKLTINSIELTRGLEKKDKVKPLRVPPGAEWKKPIFRILPPKDGVGEPTHVEIQIGRRKEVRSFVELGMCDDRTRPVQPDSSWRLLILFARNQGVLSWKDAGATLNARAHVKVLRKRLRRVIPIKGNPIEDYDDIDGWKMACTIIELQGQIAA